MATRIIRRTWKVEDVLTDVTTAKLSDPTGAYGVWNTTDDVLVVADGVDMTKVSTGVYEYSFTDTVGKAYTAYVEFVYGGAVHHFEHDIAARAAVGDMVASYSSLLERVGHQLFGIRSGFTGDQTDDIEECIKDGLRDVYAAHSWSFFRPVKEITTTAPYDTGTITVVDGVVTLSVAGTFPSWAAVGVLKVDDDYYDVDTRDGDNQVTLEDLTVNVDAGTSYELGRPEYDLPTSCEAIEGDLFYEPGQSDFYPPIRQKHDGEIRRLRQDDPYHDRPIYYGIRTVEFDPTVGSRRRLSLYPTPDAAYVFHARMQLRPVMVDAVNQYPVGGESLSQLIVEACLAAAERNYDENLGQHSQRFAEMLPLAIRADQEATSPTSLGADAPRGETADWPSRSVRMGTVTLNGTEM